MQRYGSIYLITNTVTKEQYVGQTRLKSVNTRWRNHVKKVKPPKKIKPIQVKKDPQIVRDMTARLKWKPVYCPQLEFSFLSRKAAAEHLGVLRTSISNAIKQKGVVAKMYTMESVI
jgi:hypothetical protein